MRMMADDDWRRQEQKIGQARQRQPFRISLRWIGVTIEVEKNVIMPLDIKIALSVYVQTEVSIRQFYKECGKLVGNKVNET